MMLSEALHIDEPRGLRRWLTALAAAALLHVSVAAAAFYQLRDEELDDDVSGAAMAVDLAQLSAPASDDVAPKIAPPTPQVAAQQAMPEVKPSEQVQEKTETLPDLAPSETAEAVLPKPATDADPEKQEKPDDTPPRPAIAASVAQEAAALPSVAAPASTRAAALSTGISPSARKSKTTWQKTLLTHLDKFKRYPEAARAAATQGETVIELTMDRTGAVRGSQLVRSSGSHALDEEALSMLKRAEPLPQPPSDVTGEVFMMAIPVRFKLR